MDFSASSSDLWVGRIRGVLRIGTALLFMQHGSMKLFVYPSLHPGSPVDLFSILGLAGVLEFFGGLVLVVGLFTRPVAAVLAVEMAIAYVWKHAPQNLFPVLSGGELALLFGMTFLYLAFAGPGAWSTDAWLQRRRKTQQPLAGK